MLVLISVFAIFIPALVLPGPDFVAVVRSSMTGGTLAGLKTTVGVSVCLGLYATLSLLGLSAILMEFQWLAWAIRVLGGCYLIYLGVRLVFAKPQELAVDQAQGRAGRSPLIFGFLVTLTNPKAIVLFASVFATSITAQTPAWVLVAMVVLVVLSALAWYSLVSLFMSSRLILRRFSDARHWVERFAGVCFVAIGGRILADSRNPVTV
ncbi:LysE family translocator [Chelativorans xinjiangense]|uniref:LysE family translocator n=1 Tax=Chelativorans xinjiangense TaxID=2681485 RepID=UPI001FE38FF2|nr:LysE family translocator [Chelativorans xinjiangense]